MDESNFKVSDRFYKSFRLVWMKKKALLSKNSREIVYKLTRMIAFEYSLWVSSPFLKKNLCSRKPLTRPSRRNWTTITLARVLTSWSLNRRNQASKQLTLLSAIMPEMYVYFSICIEKLYLFFFSFQTNAHWKSLYSSLSPSPFSFHSFSLSHLENCC